MGESFKEDEELDYYGTKMEDIDTLGRSPNDIRDELYIYNRTVEISLEPGDATRYNLVICRLATSYLVTRIVSNEAYSIITPISPVWIDTKKLSNNNQWAEELLSWYLRKILV